MTTVLNGEWIDSEMTKNASGGTELMTQRLIDNVDSNLLIGKQIHVSRVTSEVDSSCKQILVAHDLAGDPQIAHLSETVDTWDAIVFVSHWQRQQFHNTFPNLPWDKTHVIPNAISPLEMTSRKEGPIKLIYTSTPHRGLELLYHAFNVLSNHFDVELDVYSSFKLYGWEQRDEPFKPVFDKLIEHPRINYHGAVSNDHVRSALQDSDIFAYPSIWPETSCLCLIEAMSAGLTCVHSSYGALPETSKSITWQYRYTDVPQNHLNEFYGQLYRVCSLYETSGREFMRTNGHYQKTITDHIHNLGTFKKSWETLLQRMDQ